MFYKIEILGLLGLLGAVAVALLLAAIAKAGADPNGEPADYENDGRPHIWVSPRTLQRLEPVIAKISPNQVLHNQVLLLTRWHWFAAFSAPEVTTSAERESIIAPQAVGAVVLFGIIIGYGFVKKSDTTKIIVVLGAILIGVALITIAYLWLKTRRWRHTFLVITRQFIAVVISPPPGIFWINYKAYVFMVDKVENVHLTGGITAARTFAGSEIGGVHVTTLGQDDDDWVLDMKLLPKPTTIHRTLYDICPELQAK